MESLHVLILSVLVLTPRCALYTFSGGKVFVSLQDPNPRELSEQHVACWSLYGLILQGRALHCRELQVGWAKAMKPVFHEFQKEVKPYQNSPNARSGF